MSLTRMVRWDAKSDRLTNQHKFKFVIIGDERQTNRIKQKFLEMAQPTEDDRFLTEGNIPNSELKYAIFAVTSYKMTPTKFQTLQKKLYNADIKRNSDICARRDDVSLITYVENEIAKNKMPFCR